MSHNQDQADITSYPYCSNNPNELGWDHPNSELWPEVFCSGREEFAESFYLRFPWARGFDPFEEIEESPSAYQHLASSGGGLPIDVMAEAPPVLAFIKGLISLELDDLHDEEHHCTICREIYRSGSHEEVPLALPCGHVVGKDCLIRWLSCVSGMRDEHPHDTCPVCRSKLVEEIKKPIDTMEGLCQLLRDVNYLLTASGPLTLTETWRRRWEDVKQYANGYLREERSRQQQIRLRHRTLMQKARDEINEMAWSDPAIETDEQKVQLRDSILKALNEEDEEGIIKEYLEQRAGFRLADGKPDWSTETLEADLDAMPFGLGQLIQDTYTRYILQGQIGDHIDYENN